MPNLWVTRNYYENEFNVDIKKHEGFGGHADWLEVTDCAKISILKSYENSFKTFKVGSDGLCVSCGDITSNGCTEMIAEKQERFVANDKRESNQYLFDFAR